MVETLTDGIVGLVDPVLGWLLALPSDAALAIVAVGSAAALIGVRRFTTDQDLLRRCAHDKRRLKERLREAKRRGDKESAARLRAAMNRVGLKQLGQEGWPLVAALVPIVLVMTWGLRRLEFHPPAVGEPFEVAAYFPLSAEGEIVHAVPLRGPLAGRPSRGAERGERPAGWPGGASNGLEAEGGWVREVAVDPVGEKNGLAVWTLKADTRPEAVVAYDLAVRFRGETVQKRLVVGAERYARPVEFYDGPIQAVEVRMEPVKLFGIVPGVPYVFAPWLVGYVLLVVPASLLLKRVLRIY